MSSMSLLTILGLAPSSFLAIDASSHTPNLSGYAFESYMKEFGKAYNTPAEFTERRAIFEQNVAKIAKHNAEFEAGQHSWWMDVNHLADWTEEEFRSLRSAHLNPSTGGMGALRSVADFSSQPNPSRVDWREKDVVTPVKNQGQCGSCWAFSTTETLESHLAIATGKLKELSPQALVDCMENPHECGGQGGCKGATCELGFNYTKTSGLPLIGDMPYLGKDGKCKAFASAATNDGYVQLPANDAGALETAVANVGPISITVAAELWAFYSSGVFHGCSTSTSASGSTVDHAVQLVGYGMDGDHGYWLVRNSWGPSWGEKGYIRISRKNDANTFTDNSPADGVVCKPYPKKQIVGGECGILIDSSYPTGVKDATSDVVV